MQYRNLGNSNLKVSALCLGTMMFGDQTTIDEARSIVADAHANGVNYIDTADVYTKGASETMVGELIKPTRHDWVLATKLGNPMSQRPNEGHYSRSWMLRAVDAALGRLQTDYIDILYMHRDYNGMNLEEPLRALDALLRAGKIRYWGVSNFRGWRIAEIVSLAAQIGMPGQPPAEGTRAGRADKRMVETEFREESLVIAQTLKEHAQSKGVSLAHFATAWVLANPTISSVIAGPRTLKQWQDYLPALDYAVTMEDEALVDSLVKPGHSSTHGYTDPMYPLNGRVRG